MSSEEESINMDQINKILVTDKGPFILLARLKEILLFCEELSKYIRQKQVMELLASNNYRDYYKQFFDFTTFKNIKNTTLFSHTKKISDFDESFGNIRLDYSNALSSISNDLHDLFLLISKTRKTYKKKIVDAEKKLIDIVNNSKNFKNRYDNLFQIYRKLQTDKSKLKLSSKNSKIYDEEEQEIYKKVLLMKKDYKNAVEKSIKMKNRYDKVEKPEFVTDLRDTLQELTDSIVVHLKRYNFSAEEYSSKLNSLVSPESNKKENNEEGEPEQIESSMKSLANSIDFEKDLYHYLNQYTPKLEKQLLTDPNIIPIELEFHEEKKTVSKKKSSKNLEQQSKAISKIKPKNNSTTNISTTKANSTKIKLKSESATSLNKMEKSTSTTTTNSDKSKPETIPKQIPQVPLTRPINLSKSKSDSKILDAPKEGENSKSSELDKSTKLLKSNESFPNLINSTSMKVDDDANIQSKPLDANSSPASKTQSEPINDTDNKKLDNLATLDDTNQNSADNSSSESTSISNVYTFGSTLEDLAERSTDNVPIFITKVIEYIKVIGKNNTNWYDKDDGEFDMSSIDDLITKINRDPKNLETILVKDTHPTDDYIKRIAHLLKAFFFFLPRTLLPVPLEEEFLICIEISSDKTKVDYMHNILYTLPDIQYWTLRELLFFFKYLITNSKDAKLRKEKICQAWASILIPSSKQDSKERASFQRQILDIIISATDQAFTGS